MSRDRSLLAWGFFLGGATLVAAVVTDLNVLGAWLAAAGLVVVFAVLWFFSLRSRQDS